MKYSYYLIFFLLGLNIHFSFSQENKMDLRGKDLQNQIFTLTHFWQLEFGKFLSAEEMKNIDSPVYSNVPEAWNDIDFRGEKLPSTGFATYYLNVKVDKSLQELAINGKVASTNYRLYVNGHLLGEVGKVGKSKNEAEPLYLNQVYRLPTHEGSLDIIYHVSNYDYRKGGLLRAPDIGAYELVQADKAKKISLSFFLIGSIFFMGLYHLGSNFFRTRNKMNTYFALVCLFTILRTLSVNEYLLVEYLNFPWWLSTRIELTSFYLILAFTVRFIYYLFPKHIPKFFAHIPYYLGISATIITIFIPIVYSSNLVPIMQVVTVITGTGLLYYIAKASLTGKREVIVALFGFLLLFAVTLIEILIHQSHIVGEMIFALGIFFYLFSHVIILANRQNQTYIENQDLSLALQQSNIRLEKTVEERTKELNKRNHELTHNNEELKRIHEEKNGLIHVLAHDLKSPLNNNKGLIQLVKMPDNLTDQQKDYLDKLEKSNEQGVQIIEDLLQLYRIESHNQLEISKLNVQSCIEEFVRKHEDNAQLKNIKIDKLISSNGKDFHTDQDKLNRIMDNLISNALKFSYENCKVYVTARQTNKELHIEVKDEGMGVLKEEQPKLFQKFQKMSNKPTAGESSSGLGLSIVKTLVEQLQGTIEFESEPRRGTSFRVVLPDLG